MNAARILVDLALVTKMLGLDPKVIRSVTLAEDIPGTLAVVIEHADLPEVADGAQLPHMTVEMTTVTATVPTGRLVAIGQPKPAEPSINDIIYLGRADPETGRIVMDKPHPWQDGQTVRVTTQQANGTMPGGLKRQQVYLIAARDETGFELCLESGETPRITSAGDQLLVLRHVIEPPAEAA